MIFNNDPSVRFIPKEVDKFTPVDDRKVVGAYSLSKAIATQMVLDSVKVMGLKACVVHPSGILGPNDHALGETTRTVLKKQRQRIAPEILRLSEELLK